MDLDDGNSAPKRLRRLTSESTSVFAEGITLVLSRWYLLKTELTNNADGLSFKKVDHLYNDILSWFKNSKEPQVQFYDLVELIEDAMLLFFSVEIEFDENNEYDEISEVVSHLISIYEDCLEGNYEEIEKLRNEKESKVQSQAIAPQSQKVVNNSDDDGGALDMSVEEQKPSERAVEPAEDGWNVVPCRRRNRPSKH